MQCHIYPETSSFKFPHFQPYLQSVFQVQLGHVSMQWPMACNLLDRDREPSHQPNSHRQGIYIYKINHNISPIFSIPPSYQDLR
jgi:hypothetical protein